MPAWERPVNRATRKPFSGPVMNDSAKPKNVEVTVTPLVPMVDSCSRACLIVDADAVNEMGAVVCPPISMVNDNVPSVIEKDSGASDVPSTVSTPWTLSAVTTVHFPGSPVTVTFPAPIDGRASSAAWTVAAVALYGITAVSSDEVDETHPSLNVPLVAASHTVKFPGFRHDCTSSADSYIGFTTSAVTTAW